MVSEVVQWDRLLSRHTLGRSQLVLQLFAQLATKELTDAGQAPVHDPNLAPWLGTDRFISIKEWQGKADSIGSDYPPVEPRRYTSLNVPNKPEILVTAIASLYRGGDYIEQFLDNITSQTIFATHCELIIIDADSPEGEAAVIARYMERFPNIVYHRASTRIGIYEAWNLGVEMSRGQYLTNTNLDDLRRSDSFERQVEILEAFRFVDVVYQDFYYSFDGKAPFAKTAAVGFKSEVPVVTPYNLMQSNSPHNAPMWRRSLHEEIGMFDEGFRSAGDYDFWLRCIQGGKTFFKLNDPHVVYFVNPEGLSTQPNTRGIDEANRSTKRHGRKLLSPWLLSSDEEFMRELSRLAGVEVAVGQTERAAFDWRYVAAQRALRLAASSGRSDDRSIEDSRWHL
nr:glycosyltransferase [Variovorax sp. dw_308]